MLNRFLRLIPGTTPYAEKYFLKYLQKIKGDNAVILEITWEDGVVSYEGADHNKELGAYVTEDGFPFFIRGEYDGPDSLANCPLVRVDADLAAPIDRTFSRAMGREATNEYARTADRDGETASAVADGGVAEKDHIYDFRPGSSDPDAVREYVDEHGYAGETYSLTAAKQRVTNAVSPRQVKEAIDWARKSEQDMSQILTYVAIAFGVGIAIPVLLWLVVWFVGQLGGGGGGVTLPGLFITYGWVIAW